MQYLIILIIVIVIIIIASFALYSDLPITYNQPDIYAGLSTSRDEDITEFANEETHDISSRFAHFQLLDSKYNDYMNAGMQKAPIDDKYAEAFANCAEAKIDFTTIKFF